MSILEDTMMIAPRNFRNLYKDNVLRCKNCSYYTTSFYKWVDHVGKHVHRCKFCPFSTKSEVQLKKHTEMHRSRTLQVRTCGNVNIESYSCKECKFQTDITVLLKEHIQKCHRVKVEQQKDLKYSIRGYMCRKCGFETFFILKWLQHSKTCVGNKEDGQISGILDEHFYFKWPHCNECSYKAKLQKSIDSHKVKAHSFRFYRAFQYRCKTTRNGILNTKRNTHYLKDDERKWYRCGHCSYKAKTEESLKKHMFIHHKDENNIIEWYECQKCPYKTTVRVHMTKHVNRCSWEY